MPDLIVSDSSPIISLARTKKLHLIQDVYGKIIIPVGVYDEIVTKGKGKPGAEEVKHATWISFREIKNQAEVKKLMQEFNLGLGESEAIVLAQELKADLLVDDWDAIREARRRGIEIASTHLILVEAKRKNLIRSVKEELEELIAFGFRTTPELVKKTLQKAEE